MTLMLKTVDSFLPNMNKLESVLKCSFYGIENQKVVIYMKFICASYLVHLENSCIYNEDKMNLQFN